MPELQADVPTIDCFIRDAYLYDFHEGEDGYTPVQVFGLQSIESRALLFLSMSDGGAVRDHTPISAFCTKEHPEHIPLEYLQLWNNFSVKLSVHEFNFLKHLRCQVALKDKSWHWGTYRFTIDWYGNQISEAPGEGGHKSGHVIELDCGCFVVQPNHRILWRESSFITKPLDPKNLPRYRTNSRLWIVERDEKWVTEPDERYFYGGMMPETPVNRGETSGSDTPVIPPQ